jgi:hypothetical protein
MWRKVVEGDDAGVVPRYVRGDEGSDEEASMSPSDAPAYIRPPGTTIEPP